MKKVLINLDELNAFIKNSVEFYTATILPLRHIGGENATLITMYHNAKKWFDSQPAAPQWVSVQHGLPENDDLVFVSIMETGRDTDSSDFGCSVDYSWGLVKIGRYHDKEKNWGIIDYTQQGDFLEVTHWMHIPPLGEENE